MAKEEPVWNKPAGAKLGTAEVKGQLLISSLPSQPGVLLDNMQSTLERKHTFLIGLWLAVEAGQENIFMSQIKLLTGTKQRKEKLSSWLCQEVPRLNICFWVLSENVLERGQYLNYWAEEKECDLSSANGLHSAEGLDPRAGLWFSHSWFSSFALGLNSTISSPGSRAHTLMTERISLPPYCMTQLLIILFYLLLVLLLQRILT